MKERGIFLQRVSQKLMKIKKTNKIFMQYSYLCINKMKRSFIQAAVVSILLYGCTTWMLTKRLEKKLDGNYTRMLRAILNKSWRKHPTRHQLYGHLPPITKTIQARRTRHAGHTFSSYVRIRDVALKTCQRRWTIGRSGEKGSGISVLAARHDDDDDDR